jgi:hypothetical protein
MEHLKAVAARQEIFGMIIDVCSAKTTFSAN